MRARDLDPVRRDDLGGGGRRRRAPVGDEVGDRGVGLVADGGDDGHAAGEDRARDELVVERPELLDRAAAAAGDDHVDVAARVELLDGADDAGDGVGALHGRRRKHDLGEGPAALEHVADVVEDGAGLRRDDADAAREARQRALARLVEQALFLEAHLEALELRLERAGALGLHEVDIDCRSPRCS